MLTTEKILEVLTTEDVINIMTELGSKPPKLDGKNLLFTTVCHGGDKHKLHFYADSKFFQCYTNCGTMSIFDVIMNANGWPFKDAKDYIVKYKNLSYTKRAVGLQIKDDNRDLEFLNNHLYSVEKQKIELPDYNPCVLNVFDNYLPSSWVDEGISEEVMVEFGVAFYFNQYKGIIPHYSIDGKLIGIQSRNFFKSEVDKGRKYVPITIQGLTYRYPTHFNLYGLYQNKENIKRYKKAIIFESPKSVWLYGTMYGQENNIALASCGLVLSAYQRDLLLDLGVEEVIIAWDKQYRIDMIDDTSTSEYREYVRYIKSIKKACGLFMRYIEVSVILDWEDDGIRISYKDAPIDNGKEIFEELLKERYLIDNEDQFEELIQGEI